MLQLVLQTAPGAMVEHKSGRSYVAAKSGQVTILAHDAATQQMDTLMFAASDFTVQASTSQRAGPAVLVRGYRRSAGCGARSGPLHVDAAGAGHPILR
jgi:hypothetical protein